MKLSLHNGNFGEQFTDVKFAGWRLQSIDLYFSSMSLAVELCCQLPNKFLINWNSFGLFGLYVEIKERTCFFSFVFSESRTSEGTTNAFFIPCVTTSFIYS